MSAALGPGRPAAGARRRNGCRGRNGRCRRSRGGRFETLGELTQPIRIPRQRATGVGARGFRLVVLVQRAIGAHQLDPTLDVGAVLFQAIGKPTQHRVHRSFVLPGGQLRRRRAGGHGGLRRQCGCRRSGRSRSFAAVVELAQLVGIAGQRLARIGDGALQLVVLAEHTVGANQLQPALNVGPVLFQPIGEAVDHAVDRLVLLLGREFGRRRDVGRARTGRAGCRCRCCPCRRVARQSVADHFDPGRIRRRANDEIVPDLLGLGAPAILIGRHAHVEARHNVLLVERQRTVEGGFGLGGDDAIGGGHNGLAVVGLALGVAAVKGDHIAPGSGRIVKTANAHIDRRQHFPGAAIPWIARQVILHLGDQVLDIARIACRLRACRQRFPGKSGEPSVR